MQDFDELSLTAQNAVSISVVKLSLSKSLVIIKIN